MNHPTLKNPRLCRILTYVIVVGAGLLPIVLVFLFPAPDVIRIIVLFASLLGLLIYLVRNFLVLMAMDMTLAMLSCYRTVRTKYILPTFRTPEMIRKSILHYGVACEPTAIKPTPSALRYRFSNPMTIYSRGIERIVAAYEIDYLDREVYRAILSSAKTNSRALSGKKKAFFLDKQQKKSPLHRVTVILILAHSVDVNLTTDLYELVCKQCGDEQEDCIVPCVINMTDNSCVFNALRVPYIGFSYAVKNRGIRIIKNKVFGGHLPLTEEYQLSPDKDLDPNTSLWEFWKDIHTQLIGAERVTKKRFESMTEREIRMFGDILYLKWDQRGVCQTIYETKGNVVRIEAIQNWAYPKSQPIGKKTILKIEDRIRNYYQKIGITVLFDNDDSQR